MQESMLAYLSSTFLRLFAHFYVSAAGLFLCIGLDEISLSASQVNLGRLNCNLSAQCMRWQKAASLEGIGAQ
jgi:hypothetical protein